MVSSQRLSLFIPKSLYDQLEALARRIHISHDHLIELAIENLINSYPGQALPIENGGSDEEVPNMSADRDLFDRAVKAEEQIHAGQLLIHQGDLFWVKLTGPDGAEPGYAHPFVVIQEDVINHCRLNTLVVCSLTSNIKRVNLPGNVLLAEGEANLPRQSVVEVSKVSMVDKAQLGEYIGSLPPLRIQQILEGMRFLQRMIER